MLGFVHMHVCVKTFIFFLKILCFQLRDSTGEGGAQERSWEVYDADSGADGTQVTVVTSIPI